MIAAATKKEEEEIELLTSTSIENLKSNLMKQYPSLAGMSFQMAKNHNIVDPSELIRANDEVALLPPFAGG